MTGPLANDCTPFPHIHVGICQHAGYANGFTDGLAAAQPLIVTLSDADRDQLTAFIRDHSLADPEALASLVTDYVDRLLAARGRSEVAS